MRLSILPCCVPCLSLRASRALLAGAALFAITTDGLQAQVVIGGDVDPSPASSPVWNVGGILTVGDTGVGTLDISAGGLVTDTFGTLGNFASGNGTATVTGGTWTNSATLSVGRIGTGTLEISGTGTVGSSTSFLGELAGSEGTAKVSGGSWNTTNTLFIGSAGTGTLEISGTGAVSSDSGVIANELGSEGTVKVSGGSWTMTGPLDIATRGTGTLEISGTGAVSSDSGQLGGFAGSEGTVRVSSGTWTNTNDLNVGSSGKGTLEISGTGAVSSLGGEIGSNAGGEGIARVSGGSWTMTDLLTVGRAGIGTLEISGMGAVSSDGGTIGRDAGGEGTAKVSSGSWTMTNDLNVGLDGKGTLEISGTGAVSNTIGYIGSFVGSEGIAKVSGGTWMNSGELNVGYFGKGLLEISGMGAVSNTDGYLGRLAGSEGIAKVSGGTWVNSGELNVGFNGTGLLEISGMGAVSNIDGYLGTNVGSEGTVRVSGGTWTNSNDIYVASSGTGTLEISGTGAVSSVQGILGSFVLGKGTALVSSGSWTMTSKLALGFNGTGLLEVSGTGAVSNTNGYLGEGVGEGTAKVSSGSWTNSGSLYVGKAGNGTLEISGTGVVSNTTGYIGSDIGSTGIAKVSGGTWTNSGDLRVGNFGTGTLEINGTGAVSNAFGYIGRSAGSMGTARVSGGTWTNAGGLFVGYAGTGTLEISGTGAVGNTDGIIGYDAGSEGTAKVSGGSWVNFGELTVGHGGTGLLEISGTGAVSNTAGYIGSSATSEGTAKVSGGTWTNSGDLSIGIEGKGLLEVSGTGAVSNTAAILGVNVGSEGTAKVSGGTWTNNSRFYLGFDGDGLLEISGTGAVSTTTAALGYNAGGMGIAKVSGGSWDTGGGLLIGYYGTGILEISGTGSVEAFGTILGSNSGATGTLKLNGGVLSTAYIFEGSGNGTILFDGGTLRLMGDYDDIIFGFEAGDVILGAGGGTIDTQAFSVAYDLELQGVGGLNKIGSGMLTMKADSTYSGGTRVNEGRLRTTSAMALGSGTVNLNDGILDPVGTLNIGGNLHWNGGRIASEIGTTNDVINVAGTLFNGGGTDFELALGAGTALHTPYTLLTFGSTFYSDASVFQAFGVNPLSVFDVVFNLLPNELQLTLLGAVIAGDILQNSAPVNIPTFADFLVNGPVRTGTTGENNEIKSLIFNPGSSLKVYNALGVSSGEFNVRGGSASINDGHIYVPGAFNKTGPGALNANSIFHVPGPGRVSQGALYVNKQFNVASGLTVMQNALLGGSGVIKGNVINHGTVNPGNSPGTLTVDGNYTQTSSGKLQIEIASPSVFDRLVVSGRAVLAGVLEAIRLGSELQYGQQYDFLKAGSISGEFDKIVMPNPSIYRGRFLVDGGTGTLLVAPTSYTLVAQTDNQYNVAKALDGFISASGNDRETVSIALDLQSADQYPAAFEAIMPSQYEALTLTTIDQATSLTQSLNQRLSAARMGVRGFQSINLPEPVLQYDRNGKNVADSKAVVETPIVAPALEQWNTWAMATGIFANSSAISQVPGYSYDSGGFYTGVDRKFGEALAAGLYTGYQYTDTNYDGGSDNDINSVLFGLYATYESNGTYVNGIIGGGYHDYDTSRTIKFSTIDRTADADPNGCSFSTSIEAGHDWQSGGFVMGPIAGLQYVYSGVDSFTESGADSLNLDVDSQSANSLRSTLGAHVAYLWKATPNVVIVPEIRALWQHEFLDGADNINASLDSGSGANFTYNTSDPSRDTAILGGGISGQFGTRWNAALYYNANIGEDDALTQTVSLSAGFAF